MGDLSGRRIVVPETRELGQLVRMLEERGADTVSCPMIAIRDAPDPAPVEAWLRRFAGGACDDLVLMTGEGLRRLTALPDALIWNPPSLTRWPSHASSHAGRSQFGRYGRSDWLPTCPRTNPRPKA
jgi:hypothetical protein